MQAAVLLIVVGYRYTLNDALGGSYLIRTHHQQHLLAREDAVLRKDAQQSVLGEERLGEVQQVGDNAVIAVSPKRSELKRVARLLRLASAAGALLFDMVIAGAVRVILRMGAVGDNEDLHVFKEAATCPEAVALVPVDLVERFFDAHPSALELQMHQRKAVH